MAGGGFIALASGCQWEWLAVETKEIVETYGVPIGWHTVDQKIHIVFEYGHQQTEIYAFDNEEEASEAFRELITRHLDYYGDEMDEEERQEALKTLEKYGGKTDMKWVVY